MAKELKTITEILKELELFEYYRDKDVDKEDDEESIYLIDKIVLQDDIEDILKNEDEYIDKESIYYQEQLDFITKIKILKDKLH